MRNILGLLALLTAVPCFGSNDSLLSVLIRNNMSPFVPAEGSFDGAGWDRLVAEAAASHFVVIGEDHFFREIPYFTTALAEAIPFTHFITEVDPFSAEIITAHMGEGHASKAQELHPSLQHTFSFFALEPEYRMLQQLVKKGLRVHGTDQVQIIADRLLASDVLSRSPAVEVKTIFERIERRSAEHFISFLADPSKAPYMLTDEFSKDLDQLEALELDQRTLAMVAAMRESRAIYLEQDHQRRVDLMRKEFGKIDLYETEVRALLKFGAVHGPRGESLLGPFDIGEATAGQADALGRKSLHILIVGKNGTQGSPFPGFPPRKVDPEKGELSVLKPFYATVSGSEWQCFDLAAIRKAMAEADLNVEEVLLQRIIAGYDLLVIIPEVSASPFLD